MPFLFFFQQYCDTFIQNGYDDLDFLRKQLCDSDLDLLQVADSGHRAIILRSAGSEDQQHAGIFFRCVPTFRSNTGFRFFSLPLPRKDPTVRARAVPRASNH